MRLTTYAQLTLAYPGFQRIFSRYEKSNKRASRDSIFCRSCQSEKITSGIKGNLGLAESVNLFHVRIFDHLTSRIQSIFYEAKRFET